MHVHYNVYKKLSLLSLDDKFKSLTLFAEIPISLQVDIFQTVTREKKK